MGKRQARAAYPGEIRIIGGQWRSRVLKIASSAGLRPTPNRVRETLFNWLQPYLPGARCLDVTAGTGVLCFEALSRGAGAALMVEQSPVAAQIIRENIALLGAEHAEVVCGDGVTYLEAASPQGSDRAYDIVFLDPPFRSDLIERCSGLLERHGWVKHGGLIYIEAPSTMQSLPLPDSWEMMRSKTAGQVGYHLVRRLSCSDHPN